MAGKEITDTVPQLEAESYTACGHRGGRLGPGQAAVWLVGLEDGMHEPRVVGRQQPSGGVGRGVRKSWLRFPPVVNKNDEQQGLSDGTSWMPYANCSEIISSEVFSLWKS